ncbi:hypothetical protein [Amycolatopsis thermoflava]|uniref:hypothetical protein n=1 Tax=Amycolatopsis thermoflava TaxID=84480 RepID=UPI00364CEACF
MLGEQQTVAPVTEANKGIGRGVAEQLAALGMTVLVGRCGCVSAPETRQPPL